MGNSDAGRSVTLNESISANENITAMKFFIKTPSLLLFVLAAIAMIAAAPAIAAPAFTVLHSFNGVDGGSPNSLIQTADGFLYGSAANGGDTNTCSPDGCGTLFKSDTAGKKTVLHF